MDRVMPIDLERPDLRKRLLGYDRSEVDALLEGAARALHELLLENESLRIRVGIQTEEIERSRSQERYLNEVLLTAQKAAEETRSSAQRHAEALIEEARIAALAERVTCQQQVSEVKLDLERLRGERYRVESEFRALLNRMLRDLGPEQPKLTVLESEPSGDVAEANRA